MVVGLLIDALTFGIVAAMDDSVAGELYILAMLELRQAFILLELLEDLLECILLAGSTIELLSLDVFIDSLVCQFRRRCSEAGYLDCG